MEKKVCNGNCNGNCKIDVRFEEEPLLSKVNELYKLRHLPQLQKIVYAMGHVINDILGALWFSYALIFLQIVVEFQPAVAALLLFIGQTADALATPFVGALIDRFSTRKKWHIIGVALVTLSFPFIFQTWSKGSSLMVTYYAVAIILFQIGWAIVQLSHLSLIPELTSLSQERAELTSLRYIASVCSNIMIYVIAYFVLQGSKGTNTNIVNPDDGLKFQIVSITAVSIGVICSSIFQCVLPAGTSMSYKYKLQDNTSIWKKISMSCCSSKLYQIALLHTTSRLFYSLALVYVPFFINETKITQSGALAVAPLLCFLASLVASILLNKVSKIFSNHKVLFTLGSIFCILGCICIYLNPDDEDVTSYIYVSSLLYGVGSSLTVISSLCIAANLIGANTDCGALIYSVITFADKILNGVAVLIIEYLKCSTPMLCEHYYKFVLAFVNGVLSILGLLLLITLPTKLCSSN